MQHATIKAVELKRAKSGSKGIVICIVTDDKQWIRDWIGESAPASVSNRWWEATGNQPQGWEGFLSHASFDLIGCGVSVTLKEGDYGQQVDGVSALDAGVQDPAQGTVDAQILDDEEIPF